MQEAKIHRRLVTPLSQWHGHTAHVVLGRRTYGEGGHEGPEKRGSRTVNQTTWSSVKIGERVRSCRNHSYSSRQVVSTAISASRASFQYRSSSVSRCTPSVCMNVCTYLVILLPHRRTCILHPEDKTVRLLSVGPRRSPARSGKGAPQVCVWKRQGQAAPHPGSRPRWSSLDSVVGRIFPRRARIQDLVKEAARLPAGRDGPGPSSTEKRLLK